MPWAASHRENIWVTTVNLTAVTAELLGTQKAFGDPQGGTSPQQAQFVSSVPANPLGRRCHLLPPRLC